MAKKKTKKTKFSAHVVRQYIRKHSAIAARVVVALLVFGMQFIYKDSESGQSISFETKVKTSCLIENHDCKIAKKSKVESQKDSHSKSKPAKQNPADCLQYQSVINQYNTAIKNSFAQTNQQADNARANAQNSGESYQSFDTNLNNIFNAYNNNVTAIYHNYSAQVGKCKDQLNPPTLFNMFNP